MLIFYLSVPDRLPNARAHTHPHIHTRARPRACTHARTHTCCLSHVTCVSLRASLVPHITRVLRITRVLHIARMQVSLTDSSFKASRFAAADDNRAGPAAASGYSMGSLTELHTASLTQPLLDSSSPSPPVSPPSGHVRSKSEGERLLGRSTRRQWGNAGDLAEGYI